ncbi:MAG: shikimate kinase [Steroidobacteraceae bacterium]|nr:shikimate kinase [Steroidobacteraceae bacterium]MDW8260412.1 shikimate kinase [Gammaproteobacteria bacterium]
MEPTSDRVFLIGPMGSGKSAVGRLLAKMRGVPFFDSDEVIVERTGVDIPLIFEKEGETGFRQRERQVIDELTQLPRIVLATGGGAVTLPENRAALRSRGIVVYLQTGVAQQAARVRDGRNRPMLAGSEPAQRLADLMRERAPLYESIAMLTVTTDHRHPRAVARQIQRALRAGAGLGPV